MASYAGPVDASAEIGPRDRETPTRTGSRSARCPRSPSATSSSSPNAQDAPVPPWPPGWPPSPRNSPSVNGCSARAPGDAFDVTRHRDAEPTAGREDAMHLTQRLRRRAPDTAKARDHVEAGVARRECMHVTHAQVSPRLQVQANLQSTAATHRYQHRSLLARWPAQRTGPRRMRRRAVGHALGHRGDGEGRGTPGSSPARSTSRSQRRASPTPRPPLSRRPPSVLARSSRCLSAVHPQQGWQRNPVNFSFVRLSGLGRVCA